MLYSAQSVDWKYQAKEKLRKGKERFPRFKQLIIGFVTFMFFWLLAIWFKSNFERLEEENESYELKREIEMHYDDFLKEFGKSYSDEEKKMREAIYLKNYLMVRHQSGSSLMKLNHLADWTDEEYDDILGVEHDSPID